MNGVKRQCGDPWSKTGTSTDEWGGDGILDPKIKLILMSGVLRLGILDPKARWWGGNSANDERGGETVWGSLIEN